MPRKKAEVEAEPLPPEDQPSRGRKKLVEAEHTIKYSAPVPVTVEEPTEETEFDLLDDDAEIEAKPKRRVNSEREELRKKLAKNNITPGSELKLTIERYSHSDVVDGRGGVFAETEHCQKYVCNETHITSEDYLDVARKFGPGLYRFTLRMKNQIVTAWDKRISVGASSMPVIQQVNPNDPTSPQVIIQTTGDNQQQIQPMSMRDIMKAQKEAFKEQLEMAKLMREAYGLSPEQLIQQPRTEEEVLAGAILKQPEIIENVVGSVIKRFGGSGRGDDEPWYADLARDMVKSGQAAEVVRMAIDSLFNGIRGLFPGGQNNGQAPLAQTQIQNQARQVMDNQQGLRNTNAQIQAPPLAEAAEHALTGDQHGSLAQNVSASPNAPTVAPEDPYTQMLIGVITTLAANGPVEDAVKRVDGFLLFNPQYSELIDQQFSQPAADLVGAISSIPGCEQIAQAEHAKQWIEQFQAKFFAEGEEE